MTSTEWSLRRAFAVGALALGATGASLMTAQAQTLLTAIDSGRPIINLRLRYEDVDQSNRTQEAQALTFRARLGYQTGVYYGFSALADFDWVQHLGSHAYFDTVKGASATYPTVPDPDLTALNRAQLSYAFLAAGGTAATDTTVAFGRQRILFGDQRFIGNAGWRQHEQTYDAISVANTSLPKTALTYAYVGQVNRVFGPNSIAQLGQFGSRSHLFNALYTGFLPLVKLEGYLYLLDLKNAPKLSTTAFGIRAEGLYELAPGLIATFYGAYAKQNDYAKNPLHIDLGYWLIEGGLAYQGFSLGVGNEVLQGDGTVGFSTPLATLHAFNGWADIFLTTPNQGLQDFYVKAGYAFAASPVFAKVTASIAYHDFSAQHADADYGTEWDALIDAKLDDNVTFSLKYADYSAGSAVPTGAQAAAFDKRIGWFYVTYAY